MCWGAGILLSSGVVRAVAGIQGDLGWRLPFVLQWVWPIPLFIGAYLAPESPWNAVRRNKIELARRSLVRLHQDTPDKEREVDATLAYIRYTTELEKAETADASFIECFRGTNLRRTEIVSTPSNFITLPFAASDHILTAWDRIASSGLPKFSVETPSSATLLSFSKLLVLLSSRHLTSTFPSRLATSSAASFVGYFSLTLAEQPSTWAV